MAKFKYRSLVAEVSEEKTSDAIVDSGGTHHFIHHRSSFITYEPMASEKVKGTNGISQVVGSGMVKIPIGNDITVEALHVPAFCSNILSARLLSKDYEVLFSQSMRPYSACFFMDKGARTIINEFPEKDGLFPIPISNGN